MKATELRQSILQAAVQGKLVPQNPNDEPASQLLKRIQLEKARLISDGKIKKEKPLPRITEDELPFDLPEGWEWCKLGEISSKIHYGYTASAQREGNARLLRITDIQNNSVFWDNVPFCNIETTRLTDYELNNGDILIARTGGTIGKTYLVGELSTTAVFASYLIRVVPFRDLYSVHFLKYCLESPLYWEQLRDKTMGTGQPNVNGQSLSSLILPMPPLSEQIRIVSKINEFMGMCEELETAEGEMEKLDNNFVEFLPKSILQAAVQGKLMPQNIHDEPASELLKRIQQEKRQLFGNGKSKKERQLIPISENEIPYGWVYTTLADIFNLQAGKFVSASEINDVDNGNNYPCFGGNGLRGYVDNFNRDGEFPLIGRQGALCGNVNYATGKFYATEHAVVVDTFAGTNPQWAFWFLKAINLNQYATATAQPGLAVKTINEAVIPLPPLMEQERIVAKIEELMELCDELKTARVLPIITSRDNIIPFPQKVTHKESEWEIKIAARGDLTQTPSQKLQDAIDDWDDVDD